MKKIVVLVILSIGSLFGYEIADSFQYPISSDELYQNSNSNPKKGWTMVQDFQDCRKEVVPLGITPCRHLGEDIFYYDGNNWNSANKKG